MPRKILIATTTFGVFDSSPEQRLKKLGYEIVKNPHGRTLAEPELLDLAKDCVAIIAGTEKYTAQVLEDLPKLKMISRVGVGMDNVDIVKAKEKHIKVTPTATAPTSAVAELTLSLILDSLRKVSQQYSLMKSGRWQKSMGSLLQGKSLGIIGLGKIGKRLIHLTQPFSLTYRACDLHPDQAFAKEHRVELCDLEHLLAESDIVSIHLSPTPDAKSLIDYIRLKRMKRHAIIVNTSRGMVIHEESLVKALKENVIAGAALDVFESEPYKGPLLKCENAIVTPHIGAYAKEVRIQMESESVENLLYGLNGGYS